METTTKAYLRCSSDRTPMGVGIGSHRVWKLRGNTSPDPTTWRYAELPTRDVDFQADEATRVAEELGYRDVSAWEFNQLGGFFQATAAV